MGGTSDGAVRYVRVRCEMDPSGEITPLAVLWSPGVSYEVTKVERSESWRCAGSGRGRRYTVWVGGHRTYLYFNGMRWYALERPRGYRRP